MALLLPFWGRKTTMHFRCFLVLLTNWANIYSSSDLVSHLGPPEVLPKSLLSLVYAWVVEVGMIPACNLCL